MSEGNEKQTGKGKPASDVTGDVSSSFANPPASFDEGELIEQYRVLEPIGKGGMGVVLAAHDTTLHRKVALKLLRPGAWGAAARDVARERLLREAKAMAKLSHPNVVTVHEVGTFRGRVFVAMEYVDGRTLREWRREADHSWREVLDVYLRAGRGLAAAHAAGLVHRDFKPANVLVGVDGRVRVTDFGLVGTTGAIAVDAESEQACDLPDSTPLSASLTQTGALLGTPFYMSPEQHNRTAAVDARSDQFAFCVALYEALYGELPFAGTEYWELAANVRSGRVRPPPRDSDVPQWVADVVLRGLGKRPDERYPSMEALLADLEQDPEAARRQRRRATAIAAGFVLLAGAAVFGIMRERRPSGVSCSRAHEDLAGVWDPEKKAAVRHAFLSTDRPYAEGVYARVEERLDGYARAWVEAKIDACEATHARDEQPGSVLDLRMSCLDRHLGELRALVELFAEKADTEVLDRAVQAAAKLGGLETCADREVLSAVSPPPTDPAVRQVVASLRERLDRARALEEAGKYREGSEIAATVVSEAGATGYAPLEAEALFGLARVQERLGKAAEATESLQAAVAKAAAAHDDLLGAKIMLALMFVHGENPNGQDLANQLRPAVEAAVARAGTSVELRANLENNLGLLLFRQGKYDEARAHHERALEIRERLYGSEHPDVAFSLDNMANVLREQGQYDEARTYDERAFEIREKALGTDHPAVARSLSNLGASLRRLGRHDEAVGYLERALAIFEKALGPEHPNVGATLSNLAGVLVQQGDYVAARRRLERALEILEKVLGPEHPSVSKLLNNLGDILLSLGDYDEARKSLDRALRIKEKVLGPDHPDVGATLTNLGLVASAQGSLEEARAYHQRGLAIKEKALGPDHPRVAISVTNLGDVLFAQGDCVAASSHYARALAIFEKTLDPAHTLLAFPLTGLGACDVASHRPRRAIDRLERALTIRERGEAPPEELAYTRFTLARALWDAGRDRERAIRLGRQALSEYAAAGRGGEQGRLEAERWLRARGVRF